MPQTPERDLGILDMLYGAIRFYAEYDGIFELNRIKRAVKAFWQMGAITQYDYAGLNRTINYHKKEIKDKIEKKIQDGLNLLTQKED